METAGEPVVPWSRWLAMFEDYLLAIDFPNGDEHVAHEAALLRANLDVEGYRIYTSLVVDVKESYENAVVHLEFHFDRKPSQIFQRALFTRRVQVAGKNVSQYIASLRKLAAKCGFEATQLDERVRDQFVVWLLDPKIHERLLQEPDKSTLEQLVQVATTWEKSMKEAPVLSEHSANRIGAVSSQGRRSSRKTNTSSVICYACDKKGHYRSSPECPVKDRNCSKVAREGTLLSVAQAHVNAALYETEAEGEHTALGLGQET